jgi:hypothetical protein
MEKDNVNFVYYFFILFLFLEVMVHNDYYCELGF